MRNVNWTFIILALCAIAALFYLHNKKKVHPKWHQQRQRQWTWMQTLRKKIHMGKRCGWKKKIHMVRWKEENPYGEMEEELGMKVESSMPAPRRLLM